MINKEELIHDDGTHNQKNKKERDNDKSRTRNTNETTRGSN